MTNFHKGAMLTQGTKQSPHQVETNASKEGPKSFRISKGTKTVKIPEEYLARDETTTIKDQQRVSTDKTEDGRTRRASKYTKLTLNLQKVNDPADFRSGSLGAVKFSTDMSSFDQTQLSQVNNQGVGEFKPHPDSPLGKQSTKGSVQSKRTTRAIPIMPNDMIYKDIGSEIDPMDEMVERAGVKNINKWESDMILEQGRDY